MDTFFKRVCSFLALLFLTTCVYGAQFNHIFAFGDSLSDIGNINPNPANRGFAPWTNNHLNLWVKDLALRYGINLLPKSVGGTDFAIFGDQTDNGSPSANCPFEMPNCGLRGQVIDFINLFHKANDKALYTVWAGANDFGQQITGTDILTVSLGCTDPLSPTCLVASQAFLSKGAIVGSNAVNNIVQSVGMLHNAGAKYIVVNNLPNLGLVPFIQDSRFTPLPFLARQLLTPLYTVTTLGFNRQLNAELNALPFHVIQVDLFSAFQYIVSHPLRFGYIDTQDALCSELNLDPTSPTFGRCLSANALLPFDPNTFVFFDSLHPTAATQRLIADYVFSYLQGPVDAALLAQIPFGNFQIQEQNITSQLVALNAMCLTDPTLQLFVSGDFSPQHSSAMVRNKLPNYRTSNKDVGIGGYYQVNPYSIVGAAAGFNFSDPGSTYYKFHLTEYIFSLFGQLQYQRSYFNTIVNFGAPHYSRIKRRVDLGPTVFTSDAVDTKGSHYGIMANLGLNLIQTDSILLGPLLSVDFQNLNIEGYTERGLIDGGNLNYFDQHNSSLVTSAGLQATYSSVFWCYPVTIFGSAMYNNQLLNKDRDMYFTTVSLPGSRASVPVAFPRGPYTSISAGISSILVKKIMVTLSAKVNTANNKFDQQIYSLTVSMPI